MDVGASKGLSWEGGCRDMAALRTMTMQPLSSLVALDNSRKRYEVAMPKIAKHAMDLIIHESARSRRHPAAFLKLS